MHTRSSKRHGRTSTLSALAVTAMLSTACGSFYHDQIQIPGTNDRLVVGADQWPNAKMWVYEGDQRHDVTIVRKDQ